ncbi:MAG: ATP-binding protein [Bacillota bacterium]
MTECNMCNNTGIVLHQGVAYRCTCWSQRLLELKAKKSNLHSYFNKASFSAFKLDYYPNTVPAEGGTTYKERATKALSAAVSFVQDLNNNNYKKGLYFFGPVGSGKTFLAAAIVNELLKFNHDVLFVVVPDYLDALRFSYEKNEDIITEKKITDLAYNAPILILDDLGAHNYTQWTANKIYSLLNYRLNNNMPTVITSNLSLSELEQYLGARSCSRIIGLCSIYRLLVPQDIRYTKYLNNIN